MTLEKICMRIKREMEVLSIFFVLSSKSVERLENQRDTSTRREREANSGSESNETSCFFSFSPKQMDSKDAQRRRRSMSTRKAILPHPFAHHSLSGQLDPSPRLPSVVNHAHISTTAYRTTLLHRLKLLYKEKISLVVFFFREEDA